MQKMPPLPNLHHFQTAPQKAEEVPEASAPAGDRSVLAPEVPFSCITGFGGGSPHQYATPLPAVRGYQECTNAGLKVAERSHQPHVSQSAHMCTECI